MANDQKIMVGVAVLNLMGTDDRATKMLPEALPTANAATVPPPCPVNPCQRLVAGSKGHGCGLSGKLAVGAVKIGEFRVCGVVGN